MINDGKAELGSRSILTDLSKLDLNDLKSVDGSDILKTAAPFCHAENIEISEFTLQETDTDCIDHTPSIECLRTCTDWFIDVQDYSNPDFPLPICRVNNPIIKYKHCTE